MVIFVVRLLNYIEMEVNGKHIELYKEKDTDIISWIDNPDDKGEILFTFDKKKIYNLFADYPHNLSTEERATFDKENPYWCDFFKDRS